MANCAAVNQLLPENPPFSTCKVYVKEDILKNAIAVLQAQVIEEC